MKKKYFIYALFICALVTIVFSCKKEQIKKKQPNETGTVTDKSGKVYKTVKIGNAWWMAENLAVEVYNDSTPIIEVNLSDNDTIWSKKTVGAYSRVEDNSLRYGLNYNWYALANPKKIAPAGWHIPSDQEWKDLELELGMSSTEVDKTAWRGTNQRDKLIEEKSLAWSVDENNLVGNNESGFSALTATCRLFNGTDGESKSSFWWSSTLNGNEAWYRNITSNHTNIFRYHTYKTYGFSVRCVKD